jgi:hypothetical protein
MVIFPQTRIGAVTVQRYLNTVAGCEPGAGGHRGHDWKLRIANADWGTVHGHPADVANSRAAREVKKANPGEGKNDSDERPTSDAAEPRSPRSRFS